MKPPEPSTAASGTLAGRRALLAVAFAALLLWLWITVPLAAGARTFYFRDVFTTHLPAKAFGAAQLRQGAIPAFDTTWGLGFPFRGSPGVLPLYPGNLLYLALPFWSAFNLHYALHWLLAGLGMAALARRLGQGGGGALVAALTYAGSGWMLSALTFANILTVAAWWPWVLLGAARGDRRGLALAGVACGLALLGGEPITAALGLAPLLLVACRRQGLARGVLAALAIGAVGVAIALPQIVATARIVPFSARGALGAFAAGTTRFHLGGARLLELVVPFPFGLPWDLGKNGYWPWDAQPGLPYFLTLHCGVVGLGLALLALRRHSGWGSLAAAGILFAWAGGLGGDLLVRLTAGLARYPEKLLFWPALALPLLAGWGFESTLAARRWRSWALGAGLLAAAAAGVAAAAHPLAAWLAAGRVDPEFAAAAAGARVAAWTLALLLGAALLALVASFVRRGSAAGIAAAQLLALLPLGGLVLTAPVSDLRASPWGDLLPPGTQVAVSDITSRLRPASPQRTREPMEHYLDLFRLNAFDLGPASGARRGWGYPLGDDLVGLHSPFAALLLYNLPGVSDAAFANWLRVLGVSTLVTDAPLNAAPLHLAATQPRFGAQSYLYRVADPAPAAWWPRSLRPVADPIAAFRAVNHAADPVAEVVVSHPIAHRPGATVRVLRETPDEIEIEVAGPGGLLAIRRTFQPLYRATIGERRLKTEAIDLTLLGVAVPPGRHRVRIAVSALPEKIAGVVALLAFAGTLMLAWRSPR
jgi:hypothetical protein